MDAESATGLVDIFERHLRRALSLRTLDHHTPSRWSVDYLRTLAAREPHRVEIAIRLRWRALTERREGQAENATTPPNSSQGS